MQLLVAHSDAGSPYYRNRALAATAVSVLYSLAQTFLCRTYNRHQDLNEVNGMFLHSLGQLLSESALDNQYQGDTCTCTSVEVCCPSCNEEKTRRQLNNISGFIPMAYLGTPDCTCYAEEHICPSCLANDQYEREIEMFVYELSNTFRITRELVDMLVSTPIINVYLIDDNTVMVTDQVMPQYSLPSIRDSKPGFGVFRNISPAPQSASSYNAYALGNWNMDAEL